ncbi:hypothetical protein, conserved [Entamoeba dispar SAW760]|uniref:Uncharacterized protein n=1 Tax=Entamoeba dispar (strain ATCC PRA-260 / SAW760) TaxID=370354 RepID=B0EGF3_ENTDS|nr:uncharacterized protein EDI_078590 [Entamoeba dispar SAW760]EDR26387.1 hypothetical protein, conserved [Entamoeba dispar SAW760]|eukprot:EDR26387.1 hypothetical protein, conserved [Entamoeba dispar SAW760]
MEDSRSSNYKIGEMKQLDMVYLMKVALHVFDMNDIQNIEMINKKCGTAINSLKVNPWFKSERDINKFCNIFNPPTCNCNLLPVDESVLMKVENIRNYELDSFNHPVKMVNPINQFNPQHQKMTEEEKERMVKIIQKVESMTYFSNITEEMIELVIQNMKKGIKIRTYEICAKQFNEIFDKMKIEESMYPSEMIIYGRVNNNWIKARENKNIIVIYETREPFESKSEVKIPKGIRVYSSKILLSEPNNETNIKFVRSPVDSLFSNVKLESFDSFRDADVSSVGVCIEDIINEENRKKVYKILNDLYANSISINENSQPLFGQNQDLTPIELPRLPEYIKYLCVHSINSNIVINQQNIEGLEINSLKSSLELRYVKNLKKLKLRGVNKLKINEINEEQEIKTTNNRRYWKEIKEGINTFTNLEELRLNCSNLNTSLVLNKLKSVEVIECRECKINIKSDCIERLKLEGNIQTQIKLSTNKPTDICIKECDTFKLGIESNNEQNIEIIKGNQTNVKSKCPINKLIIVESKEVNITGNEKCNTMKVIESTINEIDIKPKRIIFKSIEEYIKVPLKEAEEIYIVSMKDYIFEELFDKCKKLCIDECENCQFIINKNQIKEVKITKCKNTEIIGKLDNIEEIITIDNEECNIPETKNVIKEDTEIIEINNTNKDIEIETDKKHVIIRNTHDSNIKIESDINSDVTIENSENIALDGEYEHYGTIQFINCKSNKETRFNNQDNRSTIGCARSISINKCENIDFESCGTKKLLEIIDSKVGIWSYSQTNIDTIYIENSELYCFDLCILCNKAILINSTEIYSIIQHCKEELVMKRINDTQFMLNQFLKKVEMEECSGIDIKNDVKGKEVKMVRCHNIKIIDTSNSINQIECDNIEVITEQQNEMMRGFGMMGGFIPNNMPMGGFIPDNMPMGDDLAMDSVFSQESNDDE